MIRLRALPLVLSLSCAIACGGESNEEVATCHGAWQEVRIPSEYATFRAGAAVWLSGRLYLLRSEPEAPLPDSPKGLIFGPNGHLSPMPSDDAPTFTRLELAAAVGSRIVTLNGYGSSPSGNTDLIEAGGSYDPETDLWTIIAQPDPAVSLEQAVAMDDEVFVVQRRPSTALEYYAYAPATRAWRRIEGGIESEVVPGVWSGEDVILWHGVTDRDENTYGERYNPSDDGWSAMNPDGAPPGSAFAVAWTEREAIVRGVNAETFSDSAGLYYPDRDAWEPMSLDGAPEGSGQSLAAGRKLVEIGTSDDGTRRTGGTYDPETDTWKPLTFRCGPDPRTASALVWTGDGIYLWGGTKRGCGVTDASPDCADRAWYLPAAAAFDELPDDPNHCACSDP